MIEARLFKFPITDFEEVYVIVDKENNRLHISSFNYEYNLTLKLSNLENDLDEEINRNIHRQELNFGDKVRRITKEIITELNKK